jgi:preprotein translocase subunit YajC
MLGLMLCLALLPTQAKPDGAAPATAPTSAPAASATTPAPAANVSAPSASPTAPADTAKAGAASAPANGQAAVTPANPLIQFLPFLPLVVLFYFMILRPQKQEEKKRKELLSRMQKNDRVITAGGMYGTIVALDPENETVTLRLGADPGVRVDFTRASVVRVITPGDKKETA